MQNQTSMLLLAALAAASLVVTACERQPSDSSTAQKMGSAADKMNSAADKLADKGAQVATGVATATDDTMITAKVKAALLAEPALKSTDISVDTKDAMVTLTGSVESTDLREKVKQLAATTAGVRGVVDNLVVKATSTS